MPAATSVGAETPPPEGKIQVIVNGKDALRGNPVLVADGPDGIAAIVHKSLRFGKHDTMPRDETLAQQCIVALATHPDVVYLGKMVYALEADVVAVARVFWSRVAKSHGQIA